MRAVPLQFRGDLVLRPEAEDREVVDEVITRGRPVRQDGVIGRLYGALELPLRIEVAVQAVRVALVVQAAAAIRSADGFRQLADVVVVIERGDRQLLETRVAGALGRPLLVRGVDQGRRLADPLGTVRAELLVVVQYRTVLTQARADGAVLRVAEARARRADARLVARLERGERYVRLECREISGGGPRLVRLGCLRRRDRRWLRRRWHHLNGTRRLLQERHELSHLEIGRA